MWLLQRTLLSLFGVMFYYTKILDDFIVQFPTKTGNRHQQCHLAHLHEVSSKTLLITKLSPFVWIVYAYIRNDRLS